MGGVFNVKNQPVGGKNGTRCDERVPDGESPLPESISRIVLFPFNFHDDVGLLLRHSALLGPMLAGRVVRHLLI